MVTSYRRRREGGPVGTRRRNGLPPGQTPPIITGQTVPPTGATQGQGAGQGAGVLPTLNPNQREMLHTAFQGQQGFGTAAGPGMGAVRRLMRQGLAAGLGNNQVNNFLNPGFYRGTNDPFGGGSLLRNLDPAMLKRLSQYAGDQQGSGLVQGGSTESQANFFSAFPELQQQYIGQANVYGQAPNLASPIGGTTPPNAVLGSDGKYHDPTKPMSPGVTLEGATAPPATGAPGTTPPQGTRPTGNTPPPGTTPPATNTPQAAEAAGRDPTKHLAYWHSMGWSQNPATGEWVQHGQGQGGGQPPGHPGAPPPGTTPPIGPGWTWDGSQWVQGGQGGWQQQNQSTAQGSMPGGQQTGTTMPTPQNPGLPLDPTYEAQRRMAEDQLAAALGMLGPAEAQVGAQSDLALARMGTQNTVDQQALIDALAGRGALQSSQYPQGLGDLATSDLRNRQDLAAQVASAYGDIANQTGQANLTYEQQLIEAMLDLQNRVQTDPYAAVDQTVKKRRNSGAGKKKKRR